MIQLYFDQHYHQQRITPGLPYSDFYSLLLLDDALNNNEMIMNVAYELNEICLTDRKIELCLEEVNHLTEISMNLKMKETKRAMAIDELAEIKDKLKAIALQNKEVSRDLHRKLATEFKKIINGAEKE